MNLLQQIKNRRLALKIKQNEMPMRIGISRQQYQRLEAKGNPRLDTLTLVAQGLNSEIMLIPKEKMSVVLAALKNNEAFLPSTKTPIEWADGALGAWYRRQASGGPDI